MYDAEFSAMRKVSLLKRSKDSEFKETSATWLGKSVNHKYSYQFDWMGVPIIQYPEDLIGFQEVVWATKPDVIVECGVARGGSLLFWCSMIELTSKAPKVIGVDIAIHEHTRRAISESKYSDDIILLEGDSSREETLTQVLGKIGPSERVMVVLDSNHTEEHVLKELELYANLVSEGCYLLVLDTVIEFLDRDADRPWGPGESPWTATQNFMAVRDEFENDKELESKLTFSAAPNGFWRRRVGTQQRGAH
jgi:cephalosporin hydroxylase